MTGYKFYDTINILFISYIKYNWNKYKFIWIN